MDVHDTTLGPATAPSSAPITARRGPIAGFFIDLLIAVSLMLALSVACGIAWGVVQGIQAGLAGKAPEQLAATSFQPGAVAMIWMVLIGTGGAALATYYWRRPASASERAQSQRAARKPATWVWTVLVALLAIVFSSVAEWLGRQAGVEAAPTNQAMVEAAIISHPWFLLAFAVVLAPAYEELLFRRVLFGRLWAADRPWLGLVLSSAAFALMHEVPGLSDNPLSATALLLLVYGGMGAAFAWLYWRTRTLWAPIAAHALTNLTACLLLLAGHA